MKHNKKTKTLSSPRIHSSRAKAAPHNSATRSSKPNIAKPIILAVIILAAILVGFAAVYSIVFTPEFITKSNLDRLATEYYEEYYYDKITTSEAFNSLDDIDKAMDKYVRTGFPKVKLLELYLRDREATQSLANQISQYCDADDTYVTFYPELPLSRNSYHFEFTYSCAF